MQSEKIKFNTIHWHWYLRENIVRNQGMAYSSGINPMLFMWLLNSGSWKAIRWENTARYSDKKKELKCKQMRCLQYQGTVQTGTVGDIETLGGSKNIEHVHIVLIRVIKDRYVCCPSVSKSSIISSQKRTQPSRGIFILTRTFTTLTWITLLP